MHLLQRLHRLVLQPIEKPLGIQLHGWKTENKIMAILSELIPAKC